MWRRPEVFAVDTALNDDSDLVRGLEVGADQFLKILLNDAALFARIRSLVRPVEQDELIANHGI